ncbi:hypothetical protein BZA05DRAFT_397003, partial [Tricharina praecox]|uniref:uncharacterized protein n=1 Tax=Tricharina praecox TaxID=43433 RepID=UPI00221E4CF7
MRLIDSRCGMRIEGFVECPFASRTMRIPGECSRSLWVWRIPGCSGLALSFLLNAMRDLFIENRRARCGLVRAGLSPHPRTHRGTRYQYTPEWKAGRPPATTENLSLRNNHDIQGCLIAYRCSRDSASTRYVCISNSGHGGPQRTLRRRQNSNPSVSEPPERKPGGADSAIGKRTVNRNLPTPIGLVRDGGTTS